MSLGRHKSFRTLAASTVVWTLASVARADQDLQKDSAASPAQAVSKNELSESSPHSTPLRLNRLLGRKRLRAFSWESRHLPLGFRLAGPPIPLPLRSQSGSRLATTGPANKTRKCWHPL